MYCPWNVQGSWRKICVTDQLPLKRLKQTITSEEGSAGTTVDDSEAGERGEKRLVLLPRTANTAELWPVIVAKAILKVAALEYVKHTSCGGFVANTVWKPFSECCVCIIEASSLVLCTGFNGVGT